MKTVRERLQDIEMELASIIQEADDEAAEKLSEASVIINEVKLRQR